VAKEAPPVRSGQAERAALRELAERRELVALVAERVASAEPVLAAALGVLTELAERVASAEPVRAAALGVPAERRASAEPVLAAAGALVELAERRARLEVARRGTPAWMPPPSTPGRMQRMPVAKVSP
jgi:hypothetical protein